VIGTLRGGPPSFNVARTKKYKVMRKLAIETGSTCTKLNALRTRPPLLS